jgi:uncharacterized circularly permuted ATP-grasp superfamily protein/uncharacterized alpha-E superfamily protein
MPEPECATAPAPGAEALGYEGFAGCFDEMIAADGLPRPHWQSLLGQIGTLGLGELSRRWDNARRLIRENGVTYNVYGDPQGMDRPWQLDPLPLLIAPADAARIEAGLIQRAKLLDLVLADLYGRQSLLSSGYLPPHLLFGHPGFLRACHGLKLPQDRHLLLYAADVGRGPDGSLFVLADRTQAPAGAGYALENRMVLSGVLPEAFQSCQVQRLALFFQSLRETLRAIAPHDRDNPRIVLLSPGPYNATYFEHAFLARYLGYTLVEGSDLTVRDNRVYLKLLGGLQPVDVILRRLDDAYCDPLELRRDSFLGVPGLVQAVRAGNVALANPLGSGLVEAPALLAYLPGICRHLLGEELLIPSVATWWCGEPGPRDYVIANLARMVVKPALSTHGSEPIFGDELSAAELAALADAIRARPDDYVGQEQLALSTTPVMEGQGLRPRHFMVRVFLAAAEGSFTAMPGGLTRLAASADTLVVSLQKGGGSKDTWVVSDGPVSAFSLLPAAVQPMALYRDGDDLPSRAADNLFWLGRSVDRLDSAVRLLRTILRRATEQTGAPDAPEIPSLLRALCNTNTAYPEVITTGSDAGLAVLDRELAPIIGDADTTGTLATSIHSLLRVARKVRDRLSLDMWRILSSLEFPFSEAPDNDGPGAPGVPPSVDSRDARRRLLVLGELLDRVVIKLAAFGGLVADGMTRGQGWRFLEMGRKLERSLQLAALLRSTLVVVRGPEPPLLEAILEVADSSMTYRRRYMSHIETAPVLDLLLADEANPRSLVCQLAALAESIDRLPRSESTSPRSGAQRIILTALTRLRVAEIAPLVRDHASGYRGALDALLGQIDDEIPALSDQLSHDYFTHLQPPRQFSCSTEGTR